jgi:hypothetical protein
MCHLRLRLRNEEPILGGRPLIAGRADRTRESCGKQTMMMFDVVEMKMKMMMMKHQY